MATTQTKTPAEQMRVLPVLVGAMTTGVVLFGGVAVFLSQTGSGAGSAGQATGVPDVMWLALAGVTLAGIAGFFVAGSVVRSRARRVWESREDDEHGHAGLVRLLVVSTILRCALAEGFGLFGAVLVLLYGDVVALGAAVLSVLLMASLLPAGSRLRALEEAATGVRAGGFGGG